MKKSHMKRVLPIAFLVACLVGMSILSACSGEPSEPEEVVPEEPKYAVQIFVDCDQNLFFSKYDVDVKVDNTEIGNLEHGGEATFEVELTEGQHELVFVEEGSTSPDGKTSFVVEGEGQVFSYRIHCTSDQIEVESIEEEPEEQPSDDAADEAEPEEQEPAESDGASEDVPAEEAGSSKQIEAEPLAQEEADDTQQEVEPSKYEYAFVRRGPNYDLYYLIDLDDMTATYFGTNDSGSMVLPCTGDLENGLTIDYGDEGFVEHLRYKRSGDDSVVVLVDASGFDWEYEKTDVREAEAVLESVS